MDTMISWEILIRSFMKMQKFTDWYVQKGIRGYLQYFHITPVKYDKLTVDSLDNIFKRLWGHYMGYWMLHQ